MAKRGLTLLEIVLVVGILTIIAGLVLVGFSAYRQQEVLRADARLVVSVLQQARNKTIAGEGDSVYGVRLDVDQVVLFTGSTYNSNDDDNVVSPLNSLISLSTSSIGVNQIVFNKLSGASSATGDVIIYLNSDPDASTTVRINTAGIVSSF